MSITRILIATFYLGFVSAHAFAADRDKVVTPEQAEFFEIHVRPVLAAKCFSCHGAKKQELGIRLDSRAAVLKGGEDGEIVVVGNPEESPLISAIRYEETEMPPDEKLSDAEIAALTKWVKMGLPWPGKSAPSGEAAHKAAATHWAFQPVTQPEIPTVKNSPWSRTVIDRFILAKLEAKGITPSPEANRRTLIRRATFDLIGLPPTPQEVAAFLNDRDDDAYKKVIDRLLKSPHYGERWGRYWLDVARYADNKGYIFFGDRKYPWAYTYRDYVVRALNEDLPYDRFVIEQLAADQLKLGVDKRPLTAMGFVTLGARFSGNIHDIIDDRIDVVSRGLMGLTVTCARCHEHKFDPIPTADYYSLYGVFRSSTEPMVRPTFTAPPPQEDYEFFEQELQVRRQKLAVFAAVKHAELVNSSRTRAVEYLMAAHAKRNQPPTEAFMLLVMKGELNPTMIQRWQTYLTRTRKARDPIWAVWHACAELPEESFGEEAKRVIDRFLSGNSKVASHPLVLEAVSSAPLGSMQQLAERYHELLNRMDEKWQAMLKQAAAAHLSPPTALLNLAEEELRQVFYGAQSPPNVPLLSGWGFLTLLPDRPAQAKYRKLLGEVQSWVTTTAGAPPRAMVLVDAGQPYDAKVFLRGNPNRIGPGVPRQFPRFLSGENRKPFQQGSGRLELAQAIVAPTNPLTARVLVNRVWLHHFGEGLVRTPSDFGLRSEPPTHPLLLDYLAKTFMEQGWSLKQLHRRMMLSAVYRQQSTHRTAVADIDSENRLLWKMNRRRLDFEATRDSLLAVSGGLDRTIGGPAVDLLKNKFVPRRTIYGFVNRMDLPGLFRAFDFPDPAATSPQRDTTTIAPQALYLMNNDFAAEIARRVASRKDVTAAKSTAARVAQIHQVLFARNPSEREGQLAREYLGESPVEKTWATYTQALLLTNEFVFVD